MNNIIVFKTISREYYSKNGNLIKTNSLLFRMIDKNDAYLHLNEGFEKYSFIFGTELKNPKTNQIEINYEIKKYLNLYEIKESFYTFKNTIVFVNNPEKDKYIKDNYKIKEGNLNNSPFINFHKLQAIINNMTIGDERKYEDSYIKRQEDKIEKEKEKILFKEKQDKVENNIKNTLNLDLDNEFNFI